MTTTFKPKPGEEVWVHSMGKRFALTAVCVGDDAANAYMAKHDEESLIACFGDLRFIASRYAGVK